MIINIMNKKTGNKLTEFIDLTEMWQDGKYLEVTETIWNEDWDSSRVVQFCNYFTKYMGTKELNVLSRLI